MTPAERASAIVMLCENIASNFVTSSFHFRCTRYTFRGRTTEENAVAFALSAYGVPFAASGR